MPQPQSASQLPPWLMTPQPDVTTSPSKAQLAYQTEAAKTRAGLDLFPMQTQLEADRARQLEEIK